MSTLQNILPKNSLQVVMIMSIVAIISYDTLDGTGPFTDNYLLDLLWIIVLSSIYLIYVKESVWKEVTLVTMGLRDMKSEANVIQLMHTVDELREMIVKLMQPKPTGA